jgi:Ser/Thr protein kinase RdoA (MazF antagonist)
MEVSGIDTLAYWLGDDLESLLRQLGGEIESVEELTRLVSAQQRKASFKLTLKDGRLFKARRFKPESHSAVIALAPLLDKFNFSRIVATCGKVAIAQWISGTAMGPDSVTDEQAHSAGVLLARVHTITDLPADLLDRVPDVRWYTNKTSRYLAALVDRGALESALAKRIAEIAVARQPDNFEAGLIHGDFCADNMVISDDGEIYVIDNESLALRALDYDVARCWSRWPMAGGLRQAFAEGYERYRSLHAFNAHVEFWAINAFALTAHVHVNHHKPCQPALRALERISRGDMENLWPDLSSSHAISN